MDPIRTVYIIVLYTLNALLSNKDFLDIASASSTGNVTFDAVQMLGEEARISTRYSGRVFPAEI